MIMIDSEQINKKRLTQRTMVVVVVEWQSVVAGTHVWVCELSTYASAYGRGLCSTLLFTCMFTSGVLFCQFCERLGRIPLGDRRCRDCRALAYWASRNWLFGLLMCSSSPSLAFFLAFLLFFLFPNGNRKPGNSSRVQINGGQTMRATDGSVLGRCQRLFTLFRGQISGWTHELLIWPHSCQYKETEWG